MFLNWWLHQELRLYCGVDLTKHFPLELHGSTRKVLWEVWTQPALGLCPSPYQTIQGCLVVKHLALGDTSDATNVFQWHRVDLNLPGRRDIAAAIHGYQSDAWMTSSQQISICMSITSKSQDPPGNSPGRAAANW